MTFKPGLNRFRLVLLPDNREQMGQAELKLLLLHWKDSGSHCQVLNEFQCFINMNKDRLVILRFYRDRSARFEIFL